jgi:hypothetical protein
MQREYFTESMEFDKPEKGYKLVRQIELVTLQQAKANRFLVRYGKQVKAGLSYSEAATEFGACLMHQECCNGSMES